MLLAHLPVALIITAVSPEHLAIAMPPVHVVASNIVIAGRPVELALAVFHVVKVFACVTITFVRVFLLLPLAFSVLHALPELANINGLAIPAVLPVAVGPPGDVKTRVNITVLKVVGALSVFQRLDPFALIAIKIYPDVRAKSPLKVFLPLTLVSVAFQTDVDAVALLLTVDEFTIIRLATRPGIDTFAVVAVGLEISAKGRLILILFEALPVALVFQPGSLEETAIVVQQDTESLSFFRFQVDLALVSCAYFAIALYGKILLILQFIKVKNVRNHLIGTVNRLFVVLVSFDRCLLAFWRDKLWAS